MTAGAANPTADGSHRCTVVVGNPHGLHMRPAAAFAQAAKGFTAAVTVRHGEKQADGRSPWELLLLAAMPGAELTIEASGDDADAALAKLSELLLAVGEVE